MPFGSSPLTRGKRGSHDLEVEARGLIPAHAGKTDRLYPQRSRAPAHPRSRGENRMLSRNPLRLQGSSPLTRGKLIHFLGGDLLVGLIPAHAGKTPRRLGCTRMTPAHPRSRGENWKGPEDLDKVLGSSPLTRGKPSVMVVSMTVFRLIPAHAGKTSRRVGGERGLGAHPRSRGENFDQLDEDAAEWGSSPLTRGKLGQVRGRQAYQRLIPAHAGKTSRSPSRRPPAEAHPRSRGENYRNRVAQGQARGSSPLTRGKHTGGPP